MGSRKPRGPVHLHEPRNMGHMDRAITLNNEGMRLITQGNHPAAHKLLQESLAIKERLYGRKSTGCALSLMNIADNYLAWGKLDEAEATGKEALAIRQELRDPEARFSRELLDDVKRARAKAKAAAEKKAAGAGTPKSARDAAASVAGQAAAPAADQQGGAPGGQKCCKLCGKPGVLTRSDTLPAGMVWLQACGACRAEFYCSKECQVQDWRDHKAECTMKQAAAASRAAENA